MIRINTPPNPAKPAEQDAVGGQSRDFADPRRDPFRRRDGREGGMRDGLVRGGLARGGNRFSAEEHLARSNAFGRRVQDALEEGEARRDERREDPGRTRVLAVAGIDPVAPIQAAPTHVPPQTAIEAVAATGPAPGTETEARVAGILARIDEAYRADLLASAGRPVSLRVPLDGLIEGVAAIVVSVTPVGLDVTLSRFDGDAPQDLVQMAQLLAAHLQHRFAKRGVRILETVEGASAEARRGGTDGDALLAIGRLLDHSAG